MPKGDATWPTMTIDECLAFADEWSRGVTSQATGISDRVLKLFAEMQAVSNPEAAAYHAGAQGWRVVCMLLAEEVRAMREQVAQLERGEYICKKCGLRKDGEHPKGDFDGGL